MRTERQPGACVHEWQYREYYCAYMDGESSSPFPCGSCGDYPFCGGQMARRVCSRCGMKEWNWPEDDGPTA